MIINFPIFRRGWLGRQRAKWQLWNALGQIINRRVQVEAVLRDVATGKRGPLSRVECALLAKKLGEPL